MKKVFGLLVLAALMSLSSVSGFAQSGNPCAQLPNNDICQYQWEPGLFCCEPIPGIGCPEYCA